MIRLAQAASDEVYGITGKIPGDQRQGPLNPDGTQEGEVNIVPWYEYGWQSVFRPIDPAVAEKMAWICEDAAKNVNVGYSQPYWRTFWDALVAADFDASKIETPCGCHCASLIAGSANGAGLKVNPAMYTGNERAALLNTGAFTELTDPAYTQIDTSLRRGDVLWKIGHTAIVLDDASDLDSQPYIVTGNNLRLRPGPGTEYGPVMAYMKLGEIFNVYTLTDDGWAQGEYKGLVGYASLEYLAEVEDPDDDGPEQVTYKTTAKTRIRSGPGTIFRTLAFVPAGEIVFFEGETEQVGKTTWYTVTWDNVTGWSSGKYLEVV